MNFKQQFEIIIKKMLEGLIPLINATKFGFGSVKELWDFELQSKDIYTRTDIIEEAHSRFAKNSKVRVTDSFFA